MSRGAAVADVLEIARKELRGHVAENSGHPNKVKYNREYYGRAVEGDQYKWCAVFVWWCFRQAGMGKDLFPTTASVSTVRDWFRKERRLFRTPLPGDVFILKGTGQSHTGIVEKVLSGNRIQTLEGNYQDRVARVVRRWGDGELISRFARPRYHNATTRLAPRGVIGYTSVSRGTVLHLPKGKFVTVQFHAAAANTAQWWVKPVHGKNGYNLVTGAALFAGDISVRGTMPPGVELQYRFVETDPKNGYRVSKTHALSELAASSGATFGHSTTVGRVDQGKHLWVQVKASAAVDLDDVVVKVIAFRDV